jgi:hypothetical protein
MAIYQGIPKRVGTGPDHGGKPGTSCSMLEVGEHALRNVRPIRESNSFR